MSDTDRDADRDAGNGAEGGTGGFSRGQRTVLVTAGVAVLIYGLHLAADLLVPFMVSLFLAAVCHPLVRMLVRRRVPTGLAVVAVILGILLGLFGLGAVVGLSLDELDEVQTEAQDTVRGFYARLQENQPGLAESLDHMVPDDAQELLQEAAGYLQGLTLRILFALRDLLAQTFLILMTMAFMLLEAAGVPHKIVAAFGSRGTLERFGDVLQQVQTYLGIKTGISVVTGLAAGLLLWALGVPFAVVWGFLAFALNFIPSIGSILAAIPPLILALVVSGPWVALGVVLGYSAINIVFGSILEPMLLGRRMGLSPLVIFASMVVWNAIWGPVGMVLSVPLTMTMKIFLDHSEDFRWVAVLLSGSAPPPDEDERAPTREG